jgi:hypothetical protein
MYLSVSARTYWLESRENLPARNEYSGLFILFASVMAFLFLLPRHIAELKR